MIFNMQGIPLNIVLTDIGLHLFERKKVPPPKRPRAQRYTGVFLRAIRAARGVGRPIKSEVSAVWIDEEAAIPQSVVYASAVTQHGSQRKAATALGISLGKLQRELRKAAQWDAQCR